MVPRHGEQARYPVRVVINRTGLTGDVLRAWERRYGAVKPDRSAGKQRLYSENDIARLTLLRRATAAGHSIAEVARLEDAALESLLEPSTSGVPAATIDAAIAAAMNATERLDAKGIEMVLKRAALVVGATALIDGLISRFLQIVGDRWHAGSLNPAHEHLASSAVQRVLIWAMEAFAPTASAPTLVVATPSGERHEIGAMLVAAAAMEEGWRVIYLGASVPAADLVDAAQQVSARAIALSAIYQADVDVLDPVHAVARSLPRGTTLFVGGPAAAASTEALTVVGIRVVPDVPSFRRALRALRSASLDDSTETERRERPV
jgi:methanogenic corrinoid protein MtbC1